MDDHSLKVDKQSIQQFKQNKSKRFDTYNEAKKELDSLNSERKRIKYRRALNVFDVITYTPVKTNKVKE